MIKEIEILENDPLVLDHLLFHDHRKIRVINIIIERENSILFKPHDTEDKQSFKFNEKNLDLLNNLVSEIIAIVLFLQPTEEVDSTLGCIFLHIGQHQDQVPYLRPHLEDLSKVNKTPLKIMTTTLKTFKSQKTKLKLKCIPLK